MAPPRRDSCHFLAQQRAAHETGEQRRLGRGRGASKLSMSIRSVALSQTRRAVSEPRLKKYMYIYTLRFRSRSHPISHFEAHSFAFQFQENPGMRELGRFPPGISSSCAELGTFLNFKTK